MRFVVLTIFPEIFPGPLAISVTGRGLAEGRWSLTVVPIKDFAVGSRVDDSPYGGGPGMVMRPDVMGKAFEYATSVSKVGKSVFLSPRGRKFTQLHAKELVAAGTVLLVCGRFEGVDQRFLNHYNIEELSVGDYILSGGEIAAMAVMDACVREVPGVLGNEKSLRSESFTGPLLEYDHYTRPGVWKGLDVPEVLLSGNHRRIADWKSVSSVEATSRTRPDLIGEQKDV